MSICKSSYLYYSVDKDDFIVHRCREESGHPGTCCWAAPGIFGMRVRWNKEDSLEAAFAKGTFGITNITNEDYLKPKYLKALSEWFRGG